jgi:hypothetical protein
VSSNTLIEALVTDWDRQRYEGRKQIADEQQAELDAAIAACGPGAIAYGVWVIRDRSGVLPDQRQFCCRRAGQSGWLPKASASEERLTAETHRGYEINGRTVYPFRYSLYFGYLDEYQPVPPEKLAERRVRREKKELEQQHSDLKKRSSESLFPEMYETDLQEVEQRLTAVKAVID